MIRLWLLRALLLAAVIAIPLRGSHSDTQAGVALSARARAVFEQAGYQVDTQTVRAWGDQTKAFEIRLVARSALCPATVVVTFTAAGVVEDAQENQSGTPESVYAYGDWVGAAPTRLQLMAELVRLYLRAVYTLGRAPASNHLMLVMADPSACTVIAAPAFAEIWH
jgi:hypothetical protein